MNTRLITMQLTVCFLISSTLSGCGTITGRHRWSQDVLFQSNIEDVQVECAGKKTLTPGSIGLKQSRNHSCSARKEGYETQVIKIRSGQSWKGFGYSTVTNAAAWGWWTLGIGVGIGWLVDLPTGAMKSLKTEEVFIEMKPRADKKAEAAKAVETAAVQDAVEELSEAAAETVEDTTDAAPDVTGGSTPVAPTA